MSKQKYSLTEEHRAQLKPWADKWIANAMNTQLMTEDEKVLVRKAIFGLYEAAKLKAPTNVVFCEGPISGVIASGVAAGIWYLRDRKEEQTKLFGRVFSEGEFQRALIEACSKAAKIGVHRLETGDLSTEVEQHKSTHIAGRAAINAAMLAVNNGTAQPNFVTDGATADSEVVRFLLACVGRALNMRNGGNQWSGWVAYLSFFRHIAKLDIDYSAWQHYETAAIAGPRYMHERFTIVCDRPTTFLKDEQHRPHCPDGASHVWQDGFRLFYWRGVRVPSAWIEHKDNIDPKIALTWPNLEERRSAAEIIGWKRVLEQLDTKVIDKNENPQIGELLEVDLPDVGKARFLRAQCGTKREFVLSVPIEMETALSAGAWTYDMSPELYALLQVRT